MKCGARCLVGSLLIFVATVPTAAQILVVDYTNAIMKSGIGDTLCYYTDPLRIAMVAGRAGFIHRNPRGCRDDCLFDLGDYFGGITGFSWQWTDATACRAAEAAGARGAAEHVLVPDRKSVV